MQDFVGLAAWGVDPIPQCELFFEAARLATQNVHSCRAAEVFSRTVVPTDFSSADDWTAKLLSYSPSQARFDWIVLERCTGEKAEHSCHV